MFNKDDRPIQPFIFLDGINEIIEERGNQYTAIREVQWIHEGDTPDPAKKKLEIRRWLVDKDGTEKANKGVVFLTENGPHQLVETMAINNYGRTKELIKALASRPDFKESVVNINTEDIAEEGTEFFDMREMLLSYSEEDNKESDDNEE